jgi:hypothetical protein
LTFPFFYVTFLYRKRKVNDNLTFCTERKRAWRHKTASLAELSWEKKVIQVILPPLDFEAMVFSR